MTEPIRLRRLLSRRAISNWLEHFIALGDGLKFALFQPDGRAFVRVGTWDDAEIELLGVELIKAQSSSPLNRYRIHPLQLGDQMVGVLVVGDEENRVAEVIGTAVQRGLELLLNEAAEKLSLADETLDRYREVALLYRIGETIGATLESEIIPDLVLTESAQVVKADLGVVILFDGAGWHIAATFGREQVSAFDDLVAHIATGYRDGERPAIITQFPGGLSGIGALLWSPLMTAGKILGGILLGRRIGKNVFVAGEEKLLTALAGQAAVALNNAQLFKETRLYAQHLQELSIITKEISSSLDVETVLERITYSAINLLGAVTGTLFIVEGPARDLVFRVVLDEPEKLVGKRLPAGTGIVGKAANSGQTLVIKDVGAEQKWHREIDDLTGFKTESIIAVPLMKDDECLGVLELINKRDGTLFGEQDVTLLESFAGEAAVALENARLHQSELVRQRMEQELQLGHEMQASLIPAVVPELDGWDFTAWWQPAREVSGDFYDFIPLEEHLGVTVADVADKGVHAALFMALTRSIVRASITALHEPAVSLNQANHLIAADATKGMFVTLFYAQFEPEGQMTYVNAGHNPPLWYRTEIDDFVELDPTGIFMGIDADVPLEQETVMFVPGDFIILFTDGVTEAMNTDREEFGESRLKDILCKHRKESAEKMRDEVLSAIAAFVTDTPQSDDITLVIAKRI